MIISYKSQYIFMHSRKTAGSSIALYLSKYLGDKDLQLGPYADMISAGLDFNKRFYSDLLSCAGVKSTLKTLPQRFIKKRRITKKDVCDAHKLIYTKYTNANPVHMPAVDVRSTFPYEWEKFFKFCFVRNPYEKAVSDYKWRLSKSNNADITFYDFLQRIDDPSIPDHDFIVPKPASNWDIYTINDKVDVNFVGRFENLHNDFAIICDKIGIPFDTNAIPWAKKNSQKSEGYQSYYDDKSKKLVEQIFGNEIDEFKYKF